MIGLTMLRFIRSDSRLRTAVWTRCRFRRRTAGAAGISAAARGFAPARRPAATGRSTAARRPAAPGGFAATWRPAIPGRFAPGRRLTITRRPSATGGPTTTRRLSRPRRTSMIGRTHRSRGTPGPGPKAGSMPTAWAEPRPMRRASRRRRPMHPIALSSIPRAARVITAPVIADAERDDAYPKSRPHRQYRHASLLVIVIKIIAINPAAITSPIDVAPGEIVEAAVHIDQRVRRQGSHERILGTGPRAQMNDPLRVGRVSLGVAGRDRGTQKKKNQRYALHASSTLLPAVKPSHQVRFAAAQTELLR